MTSADLARRHAAAMKDPRPWTEAEFRDLLAQPHTHIEADADGLVVGRTVAGEAELLTLGVVPGSRRRGHGRRLLAAFEAEARRRGAALAFLEVAEDNRAALALYRAAGYTEAGRRPGYYSRGAAPAAAAAVMRKSLRAQ